MSMLHIFSAYNLFVGWLRGVLPSFGRLGSKPVSLHLFQFFPALNGDLASRFLLLAVCSFGFSTLEGYPIFSVFIYFIFC